MKPLHRNRFATALAAAFVALLAGGCATPGPDTEAAFARMMATSFRAEGIAGLDRLQQDEADAVCSRAQGQPLPPAQAEALRQAALATVKPPSDGRYLGDWREGEKLAQSGRGMTWSDKSTQPSANGGSCYNCHQITRAEISFGTIGPSLVGYGRQRGVADPGSAAARPIVEYTWAKLWNSRAFNACSDMPRFGHAGLLDEGQLRHLMALLLDPRSPVNAP